MSFYLQQFFKIRMNPHVTEFNTLYDAIIKKKDFLNRKTYGYSPPLLTLALQYTSSYKYVGE